jgi:energy-coupling factor transporter ATP-binding protein EcfA2
MEDLSFDDLVPDAPSPPVAPYVAEPDPVALAQAALVATAQWAPDNYEAPKEGRHRGAGPPPKSTLVMTRASDIEPQRINWLWPNRIATGKLSLIAGNPGLGKSQLVTHLASVVSNGADWPNGEGTSPLGNVIVFSAEDDAADTLVPRLIAAGANLDRVQIVEGVKVPNGEKQFHLADDIETLCDAIDRIGDVRLVTIDPVTAYLGSDQKVDSHKNASVRSALAPLQSRAARLDFAAVGVSHLNKGGGTEALMRVLGSMAFVAAARAAFLVVAENGTTRSLFIPMKNNIGTQQSGLAFRMVTRTIIGGIEAPAIEFDSDEITATADEALADSVGRDGGADQDKSSVGEAMSFVRDLLREGAVASREMFERGKEAGISKRSIERAKSSLGVTAHHRGDGGPSGRGEWIWELPTQISFTKPAS